MYKLCLTVKGRVRNEEKFVLDDEVISLARGDGHTIQIDWDIYVSREAHACIERVDAEKGYFRLQDMNSDWGTYITYPKQKEVEVLPDKPYWLCNGAVILLGKMARFEVSGIIDYNKMPNLEHGKKTPLDIPDPRRSTVIGQKTQIQELVSGDSFPNAVIHFPIMKGENTMSSLSCLSVSFLAIFDARHVKLDEKDFALLTSEEAIVQAKNDYLRQAWLKLGMSLSKEGDDTKVEWHYGGKTRDDKIEYHLAGGLAHDVYLLRLTISMPSSTEPKAWSEIRRQIDGYIRHVWQDKKYPSPLAVTWLYTGIVPDGFTQRKAEARYLTDLSLLGFPKDDSIKLRMDEIPLGLFWADDGEMAQQLNRRLNCWRHYRILLMWQPHQQMIEERFLAPVNQGFTRIELYLHKGLYHIRTYQTNRDKFIKSRLDLENTAKKALQTRDFSKIADEQKELDEIAEKLMFFLTQKLVVDKLYNSAGSNLQSVEEKLSAMNLDTYIYRRRCEVLDRELKQIELDLRYAQSTMESVQAIQGIQQSIQSAHLEHTGFLISISAAVLTFVFVFNSFLDIWVLSLESTDLKLPSPAWRITAALLASIASILLLQTSGTALKTYWNMVKDRWGWFIACAIGFAMAIFIAVSQTM